jgi:tetratricopeptide (TPR) repeat protein
VSTAHVERFDRDMMRGRAVPEDLDRPDREFRAIRIQMEQVEELRDSQNDPAGLAHCLSLVAEALGELGWHDLARLVYLEELDIYRALPGNHERQLGWVLTALRDTLMKLERHEEALPVADEVWQLYAKRSDAQSRDSANAAKYWHMAILTELGRHEEAVEAAAQAVAQVRRQPAKTDGQPKVYALAYALAEYADRLSTVDRYAEALAATTEAVGLWRSLGDEEPIRLAVDIALTGRWLAQLGRFDEAYAAYAETVAVLRRNAGTGRHSRKTLAGALNNFGRQLSDLGRHDEALAAAQESVRRYREVVADEWEDLRRRLAEPIDPTGDLDDWQLAPVRKERESWRSDARRLELTLCVALVNLGIRLRRVDRHDEALEANAEAVAIERRHRADEPAVAEPQLVTALNNRSILLDDLGRYPESVAVAEEAVALARKLAEADAAEYASDVAMTHNTFCAPASKLGRHDEALAASLTAVTAYRALYAAEPARYEGLLADALRDHSLVRSRRGEHAEASAAAAEAVRSYRRLAQQQPGRYADEYTLALAVAAQVDAAAGSP